MVAEKFKKTILILSLALGLFLGFITFSILFTTSAAASIAKLVPVFVGIFIGSVFVTYVHRDKSLPAASALVGPSLLVILLPLLMIDQTHEVYAVATIEIAILLACALVGPMGSLIIRNSARKKA